MIINTAGRTDTAQYYPKRLLKRFEEGYVYFRNPLFPNKVTRYELTPDVVDCVVFCSKNYAPILPDLPQITTRKLDQHDYRKKYDGYASRYAALESRMDSLEKEREWKEKSSMTFSAGSLRGLVRRRSCRWISTRSCSTGLWITQRSIRMAGWCSPSAMGWKSARRFKAGSGRGIGFMPDASGRFSCAEK